MYLAVCVLEAEGAAVIGLHSQTVTAMQGCY